MQTSAVIEEKLSGQHESFLRYCREAGKNFVDELDREDFVAYRSEYSVPREQVELIKKLLDFREKPPDKEISPPQNFSDEQNESLQNYFGIDDLAPYENVLISAIDFNAPVRNRLEFNGYKTLAELLKTSPQKLLNFRGFGVSYFNKLLATLKKFFTPRKKKIPAKTLRLANEELDEFLRDAALNHDPQIDLIISAFEKFSVDVTTKNFFYDLTVDFKDKKARPFLMACGFEIDLPDDLTLAELPAYISENAIDFDNDKLKDFATALRFDVKAHVKKIFAGLFKREREFDVIRRRAAGVTLEQIGKNFSVTRERVRQIEQKSVNRFKRPNVAAKKIFYFLHALTNGKSLLTLDDAKNFLDAEDAEILWFLAARAEILRFDKELDAFIFNEGAALDYEALMKNLPAVMEEKIFEQTIATLAQKKNLPTDLIRAGLAKFYRRSGKFIHRGRLTVTFECGYVLKERFPNGYKIADEISYQRFVRYLQEIFDEKTPTNQRALDARIGAIGFLCGRGKYIHPDLVHVPSWIMERVKNFVDSSDYTAIFYKEIFESLKNIFVGTQITNHYFLQGAMKFYKLPYIFRKDYLTKASEIDMGTEFDNFVAERGEISAQEIKENFVSFKDFNIAFLVGRCPEIIRDGEGNLIHATHLNLREEDFDSIKKFLSKNCSKPVNSRVLFDLFFERFADFMTRNDIHSHNKLFGVLQYMFGDDFNFSRPYISAADIKDISNKKFLLSLLANMDAIEIEDLVGICDENGIHFVARTHLIDSLRPDFLRVDEFNLMRPESIGITDEIISAVAESVQSAIERNGGWQVAQTFDDYEWLPQLEIPWNSFLLESVMSLADDAPCRLKIPSKSANFSSTIFLAEEFAEDDFQSFLTKILSAEHAKEPFRSEKEIFDWLKSQGLCNKKLPKFLEAGKALELLRR